MILVDTEPRPDEKEHMPHRFDNRGGGNAGQHTRWLYSVQANSGLIFSRLRLTMPSWCQIFRITLQETVSPKLDYTWTTLQEDSFF